MLNDKQIVDEIRQKKFLLYTEDWNFELREIKYSIACIFLTTIKNNNEIPLSYLNWKCLCNFITSF